MEEKTYRLIGTLDLMNNINNNFIYPIFENNGDFFFANSFEYTNIDTFEKVYGLDHLRKIKELEKNKLLSNPKKEYKIGDEPIVVYKQDIDNIFIGTYDEFVDYYDKLDNKDQNVINAINHIKESKEKNKVFKKIKLD